MGKKNKSFVVLRTMLILVFGLMLYSQTAYAATAYRKNIAKHAPGTRSTRITNIDWTGDGKKDKTVIKTTCADGSYMAAIQVTVNGKKALKTTLDYNGCKYSFISLSSKKNFLVIGGYDDFYNVRVFYYNIKKKKFSLALDLNYSGLTIEQVSFKKFSSSGFSVSFDACSDMLGYLDFTVKFTFKDGKFVPNKPQANLGITPYGKNTVKVLKSGGKLYSSPGSSKVVYTLKVGQKATIGKIALKGNTAYIQLKAGGKSGWIPSSYDSGYELDGITLD